MDEFLRTLLVILLYILYIIMIPFIFLISTPFILLWPGKKRADGTREKRPIKKRFKQIWKFLENIGIGLPTS